MFIATMDASAMVLTFAGRVVPKTMNLSPPEAAAAPKFASDVVGLSTSVPRLDRVKTVPELALPTV